MAREIPIGNRARQVIAHVIVDDADYERAAGHSWCLMRCGYPASRINYRLCYLHRWLLGDPDCEIDHINRDKLDCRRENLRLVTDAQNKQNVPARGGTSKYRGVHWASQHGKWMAGYAGQARRVFDSEEEAARYISEWRAAHLPFTVEV